MFTLAIQTGLRLSEITSLQAANLHLGAAAHVACAGRGRKNRTTPLTVATATVLESYLCGVKPLPLHDVGELYR